MRKLMPARYVRAYLKGNKNDFRDVKAIVEAVQRPTMRFVATKTAEQFDLQALHRVRSRLVSERTAIARDPRLPPRPRHRRCNRAESRQRSERAIRPRTAGSETGRLTTSLASSVDWSQLRIDQPEVS